MVERNQGGKDLAEVAVKFAMKWRGCNGLVLGMSNADEVEQNVAWWNECWSGRKDEAQERDEGIVRERLAEFEKLEWASPPMNDC